MAARGGRNVKEITARIMSSLVANSVVINLNWSGKNGKRAFGKMKLAQVITGMLYLHYDSWYHIVISF